MRFSRLIALVVAGTVSACSGADPTASSTITPTTTPPPPPARPECAASSRSGRDALHALLDFDVEQDFLSILLIPARKRLAAAAFEGAKLRVGHAVIELTYEVRAAYFSTTRQKPKEATAKAPRRQEIQELGVLAVHLSLGTWRPVDREHHQRLRP